jgi:hypothetical protein
LDGLGSPAFWHMPITPKNRTIKTQNHHRFHHGFEGAIEGGGGPGVKGSAGIEPPGW